MAMLVYEGTRIEVDREATLGRHRENAVVLRDGGASRKHARVFQAEGGWWVEDLGSANGTKHNGRTCQGRERLANGDAIRIGDAEVTFHCSERESVAAVSLDPQSLEGREIGGYRLIKLLGRSGMGFLYLARQISLDREVAFKAFARRVVEDDPAFAERFRALASKAGSLTHDGFVQLHENGCTEGLVWYSMELVHGDTMDALLAREKRFAPELAFLVCERIALALVEAHRAGIVHGGLTLRTLMLTGEGKVKILDLGIAGMLGRGRDRTRPEQAWHTAPDAEGTAQPADDVYSLGCVLYHLVAGAPPFPGDTAADVARAHREQQVPSLRKAVPSLPADADALLEGMLTKKRDWRAADLGEVAVRLRKLRDGLGQQAGTAQVQAERLGAKTGTARIGKRESHVILNVSIAVALVLAGIVALVMTRKAGPELTLAPPPPPPTVMAKRPLPPTGPPPAGSPEAVAADPFSPRLAELRQKARTAGGETGWEAVEEELQRTMAEAEAAKAPSARELRFLLDQLQADAEDWYRTRLAALPAGTTPAEAASRLAALSRLRDQVAAANRADAEARYQQELAVLLQRLNEARRDARRALESGRPAQLTQISAAVAPAFAGSPVEGLSAQFGNLCAEAARLAGSWNTDWKTTSSAFDRVRGERAIAAAAGLLVVGDHVRAKRVLLADPQLASGALLMRRQALLGGQAAVLSFDDPADMQYLDVTTGDPTLVGGALTGRSGSATSMTCTVPVGGADWQAELILDLSSANGEAVVSCSHQGEIGLMVRLAEALAVIRSSGSERRTPVQVAGVHKLRLSCRGSDLLLMLDGRGVALPPGTQIPAGSSLRIELAGSDWRLDSLQVVGNR